MFRCCHRVWFTLAFTMNDVISSGHLGGWAPPRAVITFCMRVWRVQYEKDRRPVDSVFTLPALVSSCHGVYRPLFLFSWTTSSHLWHRMLHHCLLSLKVLVLCLVNTLKENTVMPGLIFLVFSLSPCCSCFLIGITGLAFSSIFRHYPSLKSFWSYPPTPPLPGPVFSFVTVSVRRVHKRVAFSHTAEVLWNHVLVLLFLSKTKEPDNNLSLILLMITLTCHTFLFTTLLFLTGKNSHC